MQVVPLLVYLPGLHSLPLLYLHWAPFFLCKWGFQCLGEAGSSTAPGFSHAPCSSHLAQTELLLNVHFTLEEI